MFDNEGFCFISMHVLQDGSVHLQAAVSLVLLEGWILKSHLCLLFHFMSGSMISEF